MRMRSSSSAIARPVRHLVRSRRRRHIGANSDHRPEQSTEPPDSPTVDMEGHAPVSCGSLFRNERRKHLTSAASRVECTQCRRFRPRRQRIVGDGQSVRPVAFCAHARMPPVADRHSRCRRVPRCPIKPPNGQKRPTRFTAGSVSGGIGRTVMKIAASAVLTSSSQGGGLSRAARPRRSHRQAHPTGSRHLPTNRRKGSYAASSGSRFYHLIRRTARPVGASATRRDGS